MSVGVGSMKVLVPDEKEAGASISKCFWSPSFVIPLINTKAGASLERKPGKRVRGEGVIQAGEKKRGFGAANLRI